MVQSEENIELCLSEPGNPNNMLSNDIISEVVADIKREREAAEEEKRNR